MKRLAFIDDLRFFCTVLMVAYHAGVSYMSFDSPLWPAHDIAGNMFFDYLVLTLRWSRMPVVFFVSGLSAGLLFKKGGAKPYFQNRLHKIYLPLLLAGIFIFPLISLAYGGNFIEGLWRLFPAHFWFLIYLLPMYLIPVVATPRLTSWVRHGAHSLLNAAGAPYALCLVTFILILPMSDWLILDHAILKVLPKPFLLLYYTVFFTLGWVVSLDLAILERFRKHLGVSFALMVSTSLFLLFCVSNFRREDLVDKGQLLPLLLLFSNNLLSWVSLFFWTGLFMKISSRVHGFLKPINASAYWVYLGHYPLVLLLQRLFENKPWNVYLKFSLTLFLPLAFCVLTWWLYTRLKRDSTAAQA